MGIFLVCVCVALISMSEGGHGGVETQLLGETEMEMEEGFSWDKFLTIMFALGTGITFSTNSIEMHYSAKTQKVTATQMNIDGNFILGLAVLPFYIVEVLILGSQEYILIDYVLANANIVCIIIASTGLTAALNCG